MSRRVIAFTKWFLSFFRRQGSHDTNGNACFYIEPRDFDILRNNKLKTPSLQKSNKEYLGKRRHGGVFWGAGTDGKR